MHPIERLRSVARAQGAGPSLLVREAASALAGFGPEPAGLVTACRRLVDRHPTVGPMWALAARVLSAAEPVAEAWRVADEVEGDPTPASLAAVLPEEATAVVLGWPEQVAEALRRRGDLDVLLVDCAGEARGLSQRLRAAGVECVDVPDAGLGAAVAEADVVLLEASAVGPDRFVAASGSRAAAALARSGEVPVWVVAGEGRVLPARLWEALAVRLERAGDDPWERPQEIVALALCDEIVGPRGLQAPLETAARADCPSVPELLKPLE
ncbi:MAG: hypothetical protein M3P85_05190 [Actinomycetota bacterium]|nr:hypothetical protein [Actinomycetota bacterium]